MSVNIGDKSRLRFSTLTILDDIEYWDLSEMPEIEVQDDEIKYTVTDVDTIDSLAFRFYGTEALWWVLATANDLNILPTDLSSGMEIRVPSRAYVLSVLFGKAKVQA